MDINQRYDWQVSPARAREIQLEISARVSRTGRIDNPRYIAGVDISVDKATGTGTGAVVVLNYPEMTVADTGVASGRICFPYVPGLLSFREMPLILESCQKLSVQPDIFMVDGQGIAHPRRIGLASHLGVFLDVPVIGCAKSRLIGEHDIPGNEPGDYADLVDSGEIIGAVLRTRAGIKPLYVSIGHRVDLPTAIEWVLKCGRGYRLPEPTRLAHLAAGNNLPVSKMSLAGRKL